MPPSVFSWSARSGTGGRILCLLLLGLLLFGGQPRAGWAQDRPNILWISAEDLGPHLGVYGDPYADTPHLDSLAARGLTYRHVWSNFPVCAPARTTIATGMYATSLGAQHMRSFVEIPPGVRLFPQYLRDAGYFTSNRKKEDFNVPKPGRLWDKHGRRAHWRQREEGQPFFSVFNSERTHEHRTVHERRLVDRAKTDYPIPPYQPDLPEAQRNWATYYRQIERTDRWVGKKLKRLEKAGLAEETIIFFWGDHGPALPRGKRFVYNLGLRAPLIVYIPPKYREALAPPEYEPGAVIDRLVSFVDFAPTMLSLAGIEPPEHMQGRAFMGPHAAAPRNYLYGAQGRMGERIDMARTVRDGRYQLIRNYMPHRPLGQYTEYLHRNPVMDRWKRLYEQGQLDPPATFYWEPKPPVELYDLQRDPHQVRNLAYDPAYQHVRRRLADRLRRHQLEIRDTGFLPEAQIHARPSNGEAPYAMAHDPRRYPLVRIRATAERAAGRGMAVVPQLVDDLSHPDAAVRYWAATGLLVRGREAVWPHRAELRSTMRDASAPTARVVAAEALARYGTDRDLQQARQVLLELGNPRTGDPFVALAALNAIDVLDEKMGPVRDQLSRLPKRPDDGPKRASTYHESLLEAILRDLEPRETR